VNLCTIIVLSVNDSRPSRDLDRWNHAQMEFYARLYKREKTQAHISMHQRRRIRSTLMRSPLRHRNILDITGILRLLFLASRNKEGKSTQEAPTKLRS